MAFRSTSSGRQRQARIEDLEALLNAAEQRYQAVVHAALDAIVAIDIDDIVTEFNPAAEAVFGHDRADVIGRDLAEILIPPRMRDAHRSRLKEHLHSRLPGRFGVRLELPALRKDGTEFPIELTITRMGGDGQPQFTAFIRDLTQRRQEQQRADRLARELQELNAELEERVGQRTQELMRANSDLEAFSYSIAHDLRSPLTTIDGFSRLLIENHAAAVGETGRRHLLRIRAAIQHMADLTDGMLALADTGRVALEISDVDLSDLALSEIGPLVEREPERVVDLHVRPALIVRGDRRLLRQVIANLVGNAWKFSAHAPVTFIRIDEVMAGDKRAFFVEDKGVGFDMSEATRLFGPFERAHSATEFAGTGVGLSLVQKIIQRHRGRIWCEAQPRRGATFFFTVGEFSDLDRRAGT